MQFATLAETKQALIIEHDDDDSSLTLMIEAASEAIADYLKVTDLEPVPSRVRLATILLVNFLYQPTRETDAFTGNNLPAPVLALLLPLRLPTLA